MKRVLSMIVLVVMLMSVAAPAMAVKEEFCATYGHKWVRIGKSAPTCTENGSVLKECKICGEVEKTTTEKLGHEYGSAKVVKEATCTSVGKKESKCSRCGKTVSSEIGKLGHNYKVQKTIEQATCLSEGKEQLKCSRCGDTTTRKTDKGAHSYSEWDVSVAATDSFMGTRSSVCTVCGKERTEQNYPDGTLYRGVGNKEAVKVLQTWLTDCGYLNDTIDGIFGKNTEQAVKDFQTKAGVAVDGIAWPQTMKLMEKEWLVATGAYVEYCTRVEDENGAVEFLYCEEHKSLMDEINEILAVEDAEQTKVDILTGIRAMYQAEVDALYAEWLEGSADEDKANVSASQAMFVGYLNTQETVWNKQYGENSEEALVKVNEMLHDQWVELCGIIGIFCAE